MSALVARDLEARLGGRPVLQGVSLRLQPGQVTAILGPNGAGKSTLLACLAGLRRPDSGAVELDGRPLTALPARERGRRIGFLEQAPEVAWAVSVENLVGLGRLPWTGSRGLAAEDRAAVARAMEHTRTTLFADRDVTTLSGGERARVLLARALAGEPRWLLTDEPLAGLDPGHQLDACDLLRHVAATGVGVAVTLHDLALAARLADRIVLLHQGRIAADGSPTAVLTRERMAQVYGVEMEVAEQGGEARLHLVRRLPQG